MGHGSRSASGRAYGHTTGAELDEVARVLAGLVKRYHLPEKVMVYHQVARSVVRKESGLKAHEGVVVSSQSTDWVILGPRSTPTAWSTRPRPSSCTPVSSCSSPRIVDTAAG